MDKASAAQPVLSTLKVTICALRFQGAAVYRPDYCIDLLCPHMCDMTHFCMYRCTAWPLDVWAVVYGMDKCTAGTAGAVDRGLCKGLHKGTQERVLLDPSIHNTLRPLTRSAWSTWQAEGQGALLASVVAGFADLGDRGRDVGACWDAAIMDVNRHIGKAVRGAGGDVGGQGGGGAHLARLGAGLSR